VIPLPDAVVLVQARKIVVVSEKGTVGYDLAEEARLAKHVGGYVAVAEGTRLHLLDVEGWELSTFEVGRAYDVDLWAIGFTRSQKRKSPSSRRA